VFNNKYFLIIIILLLSAVALISCGDKQEEIIETIRLGEISHSILYAPVYIASAQGFFDAENLNVVFNTIDQNTDLVSSLKDNTSQIILAGSQVTILDFWQDTEQNLINFAQLVEKDTSFLMSREPLENFEWKNLNKKIIIGGIANSTPQFILEYLLLQSEIYPYKKVDIIHNIPKEAAVGAFKGGVGDFIHILEPDVTYLEREKKGYLAAALGKEIGDIAYTTFISKVNYLQQKPEVIESFVRAIYRAQLWCTYHTADEITRELKPFFPQLNTETILAIVARYQSQNTWSPNPIIKQEALDKMREILITSGIVAEKAPFERIVNNSFAKKAVDQVAIPKEYLKKMGQ